MSSQFQDTTKDVIKRITLLGGLQTQIRNMNDERLCRVLAGDLIIDIEEALMCEAFARVEFDRRADKQVIDAPPLHPLDYAAIEERICSLGRVIKLKGFDDADAFKKAD